MWLGLIEPDAGAVRLLGGSPLDVDSRRHVGVMMQEVGLTPELRVRELIDLTASYYPNPLVRTWPNVVGVRGEAGRLEITVVDGEDVLRRLLASDRSIRDLQVRRAGLAEAFVEITREAA